MLSILKLRGGRVVETLTRKDVWKNGFWSRIMAQVYNKIYCKNRHVALFFFNTNKTKRKGIRLQPLEPIRVSSRMILETMIFQSKPPSCIWKYVWAYFYVVEEKDFLFSFSSLSLVFWVSGKKIFSKTQKSFICTLIPNLKSKPFYYFILKSKPFYYFKQIRLSVISLKNLDKHFYSDSF